MGDKLVFPLGTQATGLAAELKVRLIDDTGDVAGDSLLVTEGAGGRGLYRATMAGAAGVYGALLLINVRDPDTNEIIGEETVTSTPTFLWSGTALLYPLSLADLPANFATLAIDGAGAVTAGNLSALATTTQLNTARDAILTRGNEAWTTATGFLTSLGTNAPANWINAAAIASDAVAEIQSGLSTLTASQVWEYSGGDRALSGTQATNLSAIPSIPTNPLLDTDTRLNNLDAAITSRSTFDANSDTVLVGDKTGFSLSSGGIQAIWNALTSALTTNGSVGKFIVDQLNTLVSRNNPLNSTDTQAAAAAAIAAADLYDGSDTPGTATLLTRLTETRAGYLDAIPNIPTNPLLANDYTAPLNATQVQTAAVAALGEYTAPTLAQVQSAGFTTDRNNALVTVDARLELLFKRQGLLDGVTSTVKSAEDGAPGFLATSDGSVDQVLTKNPDGSVTVSNA